MRRSAIRARWRLAATLAGLALILLAPSAMAQTQPTFTIDPDQGPPGSTIDLGGEGWPTSFEKITVTWGFQDQKMDAKPEMTDGRLSGTAVIPEDALGGVWPVEVCAFDPGFDDVEDPSDWTCATARFRVTPTVSVTPQAGIPGTELTFNGSGFEGASPPMQWDVSWVDRSLIGSAIVGEQGTLEGTAVIPLVAVEGPSVIQVCRDDIDLGQVCHTASPAFEVLPSSVRIDPVEVIPEESLTVSGDGWCCDGDTGAVIDGASGDEWGTVLVAGTGVLTGTATVPNDVEPGERKLDVCVSDRCRTVSITVLPTTVTTLSSTTTAPKTSECAVQAGSMNVDPLSGEPGARLTVTMIGAEDSAPGCRLALNLAGQPIGAPVDLSPGVAASVVAAVPAGIPAGAVDLEAIDLATDQVLAAVTFNIEGDNAFPWVRVVWVALVITFVALMITLWRGRPRRLSALAPAEPAGSIAVVPTVPVRWVEARLFAREGGIETPVEYFRLGTTHRVEVRLGAVDVGQTEVFPRRFRLVLTEPSLLEAPQSAEVMLNDAGPSTAASFMLTTGPATTAVAARLLLVNGTRVVQTAVLPTTVGDAPSAALANVASIETVVGAVTAPVAGQGVSAALVVESGRTPSVTHVSPSYPAAQIVMPESGMEAIDRIRFRLGEIVESPDDFAGLDKEATRRLLIFLANHGRLLRSALVVDFLGEELAASPSLQVVSAAPDAYLPLELAYDFVAPREDAVICPFAGDTLRSADHLAACPGNHDESVVCPLGFWGMSKVIERHAFQRAEGLPAGFLVRAQPLLERDRIPLSSGTLVGASDRVDAHYPDTIRHLVQRLETATGQATLVGSWSAWDKEVAARRPALLVLLPHTVYSVELAVPGLEIGASDQRWVSNIDKRMVPETPVVAMLLGCETAVAGAVSYERIPGNLRRAGVEIVIATLTEVLGRQAAPLTERLVALLEERYRGQPGRLGEVVVQLRRQLLAEGLPVVLTLAVFGDADWLVGGP